MSNGVVLVYFGKLGGRLQQHQRVMLMKDAETIANILSYDFGGEKRRIRSRLAAFVVREAGANR
jgi:hypothetical protein